MENRIDCLSRNRVIIADGAIGTLLQQMGYGDAVCPEALNLSNPDLLSSIASQYLDAGAEIIETNTFGGSPIRLASYGLEDKTEQINRNAVESVRAVGRKQSLDHRVCWSMRQTINAIWRSEVKKNL